MQFKDRDIYKDEVGIYKIENLINGKLYIGQTLDRFIERYWNHLWKLNNQVHDNTYLQNAWNKYGIENFEFSILYVLQQDDNIDDLERFYISQYNFDNLYNIQYGGQDHIMLGTHMSDETKAKIGEANRKNMLGKKHSEDTKHNMSLARNGVTQWGRCLLSYEQAKEIKELLMNGLTPKQVSDNLNIKYKIVNGIYSNDTYKSVYVEGWNEFYTSHRKPKSFGSAEIELIQRLYKENNNISEIQRKTGFSRQAIRKYINQIA